MKIKLTLFLILSTFLALFVNSQIVTHQYSSTLPYLWVIAQLLFVISLTSNNIFFSIKSFIHKLITKKEVLIVLLLVAGVLLIRGLLLSDQRIHRDEFISGKFSAQYNTFDNLNFFAGYPPNKGWVSQFPSMYFFLQSKFFEVFGVDVMTLKYSIFPYIAILSLLLYLFTRNIANRQTAFFVLIAHAFLAVSIYFDTFGLHFISSTTSFMLFLYILECFISKPDNLRAGLLGLATGYNYLFYLSSYFVFPLVIIIFLVLIIYKRSISWVKYLLILTAGFYLIVGPFLMFNFFEQWYITERFKQVNSLSIPAQILSDPGAALSLVSARTSDSVRALITNDIGGSGDYDFGHLALFNRFTLLLFVLGFIGLWRFVKQQIIKSVITVVILGTFFGAMVMTDPPFAYHRFTISFPLVSICIGLFFNAIYNFFKNIKILQFVLISLLLLIYSYGNIQYVQKAYAQDIQNHQEDLQDLKLIKYLDKNYSDRKLYVAAFPGYALDYIYYFVKPDQKIVVDYHVNVLHDFKYDEKYVYVIVFPDQFDEVFLEKDPNGRIINSGFKKYSIFAN